jgi:ABC-type transporter Mla subunit MlaD
MDDMFLFLAGLFGSWTSALCTLIQLAIFGTALSGYLRREVRESSWNRAASGLLVTIGICGTFLGVYMGLMHFDVRQVDRSIPSLLEGLKLAFSTSVVGMFLAIVLKVLQNVGGVWGIRHAFRGREEFSAETSPISEPSGRDILEALLEVRKAQLESVQTMKTEERETRETLVRAMSRQAEQFVSGLEKVRAGIDEGCRRVGDQTAQGFLGVRKAIAGDDDASLVTLLRRLRSDLSDAEKERGRREEKFRELMLETLISAAGSVAGEVSRSREETASAVESLSEIFRSGIHSLTEEIRGFAATVAENNAKALMEALRDVIRDFNEKLSEQFGENFKELNRAVERLLEWQEAYRAELEVLKDRLDENVTCMERSEAVIAGVRAHAEAIPDVLGRWMSVLRTLEAQTGAAGETLSGLAQLRTAASAAVPELEQRMTKFLETLTFNIEAADREMNKTLARQAEDLDKTVRDQARVLTGSVSEIRSTLAQGGMEMRNQMTEVRKEATGVLELFRKGTALAQTELLDAAQRASQALRDTSEGIRESGKNSQGILEAVRDSLARSLQEANQVLTKEFEAFDRMMGKELERCIEQMGSHLASLSGKLVGDFEPLTDSLAEVVRVARSASPVQSGRS